MNDRNKFFINVSFIFDFTVGDSKIEYENPNDQSFDDVRSSTNVAFGFGFKKNDMYSLELRYLTNRNILSNYKVWNGDFNTFSLILGYSLF